MPSIVYFNAALNALAGCYTALKSFNYNKSLKPIVLGLFCLGLILFVGSFRPHQADAAVTKWLTHRVTETVDSVPAVASNGNMSETAQEAANSNSTSTPLATGNFVLKPGALNSTAGTPGATPAGFGYWTTNPYLGSSASANWSFKATATIGTTTGWTCRLRVIAYTNTTRSVTGATQLFDTGDLTANNICSNTGPYTDTFNPGAINLTTTAPSGSAKYILFEYWLHVTVLGTSSTLTFGVDGTSDTSITPENTNTFVTAANITGTLFSDEGVTAIATAPSVKTYKNGSNCSSCAETATAAGVYFVAVQTPSSGDAVSTFIDNNVTSKGSVVTKYTPDNTAAGGKNMSGINIYAGRVIARGSAGGSVAVADFNQVDDSTDTDLLFTSSASSFTCRSASFTGLCVDTTRKLLVWTGQTFAPGANVTADAVTLNGTYTGGSETLTLTSGGSNNTCTNVAGTVIPLCISGGTFTANTNTTIYNATSALRVNSNTYNNLTLSPSTAVISYVLGTAAAQTITVNGDFTVSNIAGGGMSVDAGTFNPAITIKGNTSITGNSSSNDISWTPSTGTMTLSPTGTKSFELTNVAPSNDMGVLSVSGGSSTPLINFINNNIALSFANSFTFKTITIAASHTVTAQTASMTIEMYNATGPLFTNSGTFNPGTSNVLMAADASITFTSGAITFYDLTLGGGLGISAARTYTMGAGALTINHNFLIDPDTAGTLTGNITTVTLGAAVTVANSTKVYCTGNISTCTATLDASTSNWALTTATLDLSAPVIVSPTGPGIYTARASTITITGTSAGPLFTKGTGTFTIGTSTVVFNADVATTLFDAAITVNNLTLNPTITTNRTYTTTSSGALTVSGNMLINPGASGTSTLTLSMTAAVTVATTKTTTITNAGPGTANVTISGAFTYSTGLLVISASSTLTMGSSSTLLTLTDSTASTVAFTNNGTFNHGSSTVTVTATFGATAGTVTNGAITFYNLTLSPTIAAGTTYTLNDSTITVANDYTENPSAAALTLAVNLGGALAVTNNISLTRTSTAACNLNSTASAFAITANKISVLVGCTLTANGSTITMTGNTGTIMTVTGTFTGGTSTLVFNGDGNLTMLDDAQSVVNVTLSPTLTGDRTYTPTATGGTLTVTGNMLINPGAAGTNRLTLGMTGAVTVGTTKDTTVTNAGPGTANVTISGAFTYTSGRFTVSASTTFDLGSTSTLTLTDTTASTTQLTITGTFNTNNAPINLNGNGATTTAITRSSGVGTFNVGTSIVSLKSASSAAAVTVTSSDTFTFYDLIITPTITVTTVYTTGSGAITVNHNLTVNPTAGTALALSLVLGGSMTVAGTSTVDGTTSGVGVLDLNNASPQSLTTGFLSIVAGGQTQVRAGTLTITGTTGTVLTNAGTFGMLAAGTVIFNGNGDITMTSGIAAQFLGNIIISPTITAGHTYHSGTFTTVGGNFTLGPQAASALTLNVTLDVNVTVGVTKTTTIDTGGTSAIVNFDYNNSFDSGFFNCTSGSTFEFPFVPNAFFNLNGTTGTLWTNNGTIIDPGFSGVRFQPNASIIMLGGSGNFFFHTLITVPTISVNQVYTMGTETVTIRDLFQTSSIAASALNLTVNMGGNVTAARTIINGSTSSTTLNTTSANHYTLTTGTLEVSTAGIFTTNSSDIFINGDQTIQGIAALFVRIGTFNANTSTVHYDTVATGQTLISAATTFNNVTFDPALTANLSYTTGTVVMTINGTALFAPTATSAFTLTVSMGANVTVAATQTTEISSLGAGPGKSQITGAFTWSTGFLQVDSGAFFDEGSSTIFTLTGTGSALMTCNGTMTTSGTSTVNVNLNLASTITAGSSNCTVYNLSFAPALVTTGKTYTFGSTAVVINNNWTMTPTATALALTVDMGGTTTVVGTTTLTRASTATLTFNTNNNTLSTGLISILTGATLNAGSSNINMTGTSGTLFTLNGGTFNASTSTVLFNPNASITTWSNNAITFNNLTFNPTLTGDATYTTGTTAPTINGNVLFNPSAAGASTLTLAMAVSQTVGATKTTTITGAGAGPAISKISGAFTWSTGFVNITAGTFTVAGSTTLITVTGTSGTLWTNSGTFNAGGSTVTMNPNASVTLTSGSTTFFNLSLTPTITGTTAYAFNSSAIVVSNNLTINPTAASGLTLTTTLGASLSVTGTLSITRTTSALAVLDTSGSNFALTAGTLSTAAGGTLTAHASAVSVGSGGLSNAGTLNANTSTITDSGNWANTGTFNAGTGTVSLTTTATAAVTGTNSFWNFTVAVPTKTVNFAATNVQTMQSGGTFTITGSSGVGNTVKLRSGGSPTKWQITMLGTANVTWADVQDGGCTASNNIIDNNGTNSGNNDACWLFNTQPNDPTSLIQKRVTGGTTISTGGWTSETQVLFTASATDPNNPDTLKICVEMQPIGTGFTNTPTLCGSAVAYSGTTVTPTVTITGITDQTKYHWQAEIEDTSGAFSNWVAYGSNPFDFGVDAFTPTGTVYDGTSTGVDVTFNNGSLSSLSANWAFTFGISGVSDYSYTIGISPGDNSIKTLTSTSTTPNVTTTGLTLQTSKLYYFNVTATSVSGKAATVSSNGQLILPSLSFTLSSSSVTFNHLNAANSFTDTKTTTLTVSTDAFNGYVVRLFKTGPLTSTLNPLNTIGDFNGGTYAAPGNWGSGNTGFGYTSNDTTIQGANIFNNSPCPGGGSPSCYAPFSNTGPGDIVADHTSTVSGTPITSEQFTITYKVQTSALQPPGPYTTSLVYTIIPQY